MTKKIAHRRFGLWAVVLSGLFVACVNLMPRVAFLAILNGVFLGVVVCVIIVYSPLVLATFYKPKTDRVSQLALGIGLIWLSIACQKIYWIIWHIYGAPLSWQSNGFLAWVSYIAIIGGCLFVTAPGFPPETSLDTQVELWGANRTLLLTLGAIGGVVAFVLSLWGDRLL